MNCEKCNKEHDGKYATGRFCSNFCARSFSSFAKRKTINITVSKKLRKRYTICKLCNLSCDLREGGSGTFCKNHKNVKTGNEKFEDLKADGSRKRRLIQEYGIICWECKLSKWNGKDIPLQIDHRDGNSDNSSKENLRILCPNCHAQTETFCGKNVGRYKNTSRQKERYIKKQC